MFPSHSFSTGRAWAATAVALLLVTATVAPASAQQTNDQPPPGAPRTDAPSAPSSPITDVPAPRGGDAAVAAPTLAPVQPDAALAGRLDDIDQTARIAARRIENLEEQLAARAKETPVVQADDKAFLIKSADSAYTLRFHGLLQTDSRWFLNDGALSDKADTFLIRKLRPGLGGTLFNFADFRFTPDFAGSAVAVFDAYTDLHPSPALRLRAGKFKTPLGLERLQNDAYLDLAERALTQNLTPQRDVGATIWGEVAGGVLRYDLGIFNGAADNTNPDLDANHAKDFVGRLLVQPFKVESLKRFGSLGVHFAASTGNRFGTPAAPQLPQYRSGGQQVIFSYLASTNVDGVAFAHLRQTRLNPAVFYYFGGLGIFAEFVQSRQQIQKGNVVTSVTNRAGHATLSYAFNGLNSLDGAAPLTRFDPSKRTWGALELAVRGNFLKIDDAVFGSAQLASPSASVRRAAGGAVGVTWIPSLTTRLSLNYEQTRFKGGAAAPDKSVIDRKPENVLITRAQINF
ncbi:MAG: porin [Polyangia bacterium]